MHACKDGILRLSRTLKLLREKANIYNFLFYEKCEENMIDWTGKSPVFAKASRST